MPLPRNPQSRDGAVAATPLNLASTPQDVGDWDDDSGDLDEVGIFARKPVDAPSVPLAQQAVASTFGVDDDDDDDDPFLGDAPASVFGSDDEVEEADDDYDEDEDEDEDEMTVEIGISAREEVTSVRQQNEEIAATPLVTTPLLPLSPEALEAAELLLDAIRSDDSTEIIMNGPGEIMMKQDGARYHLPEIVFEDGDTYHRVINEVLLPYTDTRDRVGPKSYLVEGQLELPLLEDYTDEPPMMARVHIIAPPVVKYAKVTIAKKSRYSLTLDDIAAKGSMTREMAEFLKACAVGRVCIVFAGLSGAGKTTMLEAISHHFDQNDRVIVVEDTPELRLPIADTVYMTASSNRPGVHPEDTVTLEWLVRATNRMRPDRIIVGEVRGPEMSEFLVAANSGADGSMITVHAGDPRRTLDKILGLAMRSEGSKNEMSVRRDIASTVQLVVQLGLIDGHHVVTEIEEISNTIRQENGAIASTPIFAFDRNTMRHRAANRPSEQLTSFLAQRGVEVKTSWFN